MDKQLQEMIDNFYNYFNKAYDLRREIENYLDEHYDIDVYENADAIENDGEWCYGLDIDVIKKLINIGKEN